MVQQFLVLRCFSCHTFQVHQVKNSKKWVCKLCGEKQSLIKVYGQGSGADCRRHVQKLNLLQGEAEQAANSSAVLNWQTEDHKNEVTHDLQSPRPSQLPTTSTMLSRTGASVSRWCKYLEEEDENKYVKLEEDDPVIYTDCNIAPAAETRKRKQLPECDDQNVCRGFLNLSKKNRACEEWMASTSEVQPTCIRTENAGSMGHHRNQVSQGAEPSSSSSFKWKNLVLTEEKSKENLSSTHRLQMRPTHMEPTLNTFQQGKKTGLGLRVAGGQSAEMKASLPNDRQIGGLIEGEGHWLPDCKPRTSIYSSPQNVYNSIFQTDEDFDENY